MVLRAAIVVTDGLKVGSIIYAPDRFRRTQQPWNYWAAITINALVGLVALVAIGLVLI
jgi:hypothetical protein